MRLTDIRVRGLEAPDKGSKIYYDDTLKGFGVRVSQAGTKAFILATGKNRDRQTIGRYPILSLAEARKEAQQLIGDRAGGKHRPARMIFADALDLFVAEKKQKNRARTIDENKRLLTKYFPGLQRKPVAEMTTDDITRQLDKLRTTPGTSLHAFWAMRLFMRWCVKRRYVQHSPIEGLDAPSHSKPRERVLTDDELRAVWKASNDCGQFGDIVKLLILTGARRTEVGSLRTEWINQEHETICLPAEICKNKRSHTFPIGTMVLSMLPSKAEHTYLFPGRGTSSPFNGWSKAKAQLDKKVTEIHGKPISFTLHDCRRSYATNLQRLGIKLEVIEALLNHVSGSRAGIVGVYNRHRYEPEMREAVTGFEEWFTKVILAE